MTELLNEIYTCACATGRLYNGMGDFIDQATTDAVLISCDDFNRLAKYGKIDEDDEDSMTIDGLHFYRDPYEDYGAEDI